ncbi:MAG: hypothetical protein WC436_03705 [Candidatus Babeliales bacterium]
MYKCEINQLINNQNVTNALKLIAQKLSNQNINWVIITSCGLALKGINFQPNDIDILTDESGILSINKILKNYESQPISSAPSEIFNSLINKFLINNCEVEVFCDFKIKSRTDNKWNNTNSMLQQPDIIEIENLKIPVLPLFKSLELYKLMGREKDIIKAIKIEKFIMHKSNL